MILMQQQARLGMGSPTGSRSSHSSTSSGSSASAADATATATTSSSRGRGWWDTATTSRKIYTMSFVAGLAILGGMFHWRNPWRKGRVRSFGPQPQFSPTLPVVVLEKYSEWDLVNEDGKVPSFWDETKRCTTSNANSKKVCQEVWGPCFPPKKHNTNQDWETLLQQESIPIEYKARKLTISQGHHEDYHEDYHDDDDENLENDQLYYNLCRPGFLIIGQGKCGTSSLYHYLVGHPRVLPASEKQIHYFKYYVRYGFHWYMSHFPTTRSFLAQGALMTGEASPGYLPYPDVVARIRNELPGTKIICVGRDPLGRSWSSYRYNYVNPSLEIMREGKAPGIPKNMTNEFYKQYLYSFEEMLRAELKVIKKCLAPGGPGEQGALERWGQEPWGKRVFAHRKKIGLPPLIDVDGSCYGDFISTTVPRKQWQELADSKPNKFLNVPSLHLAQAMIGRSLYVYPLEWWYAMHPKEDIYFLCTEEMRVMSGEPINQVGKFLGLPSFNFSGIVNAGAYNVGGHKGYDKRTSWDTVVGGKEEQSQPAEPQPKPEKPVDDVDTIPLTEEFRNEMLDFYRSHNERLFKLVGRRCNWD